jgi:hypothetical protein
MGMEGRSAAVAAAWLLVLAASPPAAGAAPRRVALLNAAQDGAAGARAAAELRERMAAEPELSLLEPGDLSRTLEGELPGGTAADAAAAAARSHLDAATLAMARFDHPQARRALLRAEAVLLALAPQPPLIDLLAEVSFQTGLVHLREQNRGLALDAFRLVHRLTPSRPPLDPARHPPDVVKAFDLARTAHGASARLEASSTFDGVTVYLDGVRIGATPLARDIAAGPHYLVSVAPGYAARGSRLDAAPRDSIALDLDLVRLPLPERALAARRELMATPARDRAALRRSARDVAIVAGVDAVMVIGEREGGLTAAVYDRAGDRLSLARPVDGEIGKLIGLVLPAAAPGPADLFLDTRPAQPLSWYQKPWGVLSISGAAVLTIVGVVALTSISDQTPRDRNAVIDFFGTP